MTGGKNALDLEQVAPYLQGSPHEAEAFRIGVRDAIDSVIRTAAKDRDAGAIKKIVSGDNSYRREILNEMYGKEKIDALVQMAEREGNYAAINQQLIEAVEQGRAMQGISQAGKLKEPVVGTVVPYATPTAIALNTGSRILNRIGAFLAGSQGKGFESKLANTLTSPAKPVLEAIRNGAKPAVNEIGAVTSPAVPAAIAESHRGRNAKNCRAQPAAGSNSTAPARRPSSAARPIGSGASMRSIPRSFSISPMMRSPMRSLSPAGGSRWSQPSRPTKRSSSRRSTTT